MAGNETWRYFVPQMRRILLFLIALAALATPAAALASKDAPGDGSLVVRNGAAPAGMPVVVLRITGTVIGQVLNQGRIVIDTGVNGVTPEVTDAGPAHDVTRSDTAQSWSSADGFKFRIVGGTNVMVIIYGSGVNLVALGKGWVRITGLPNTPVGDGKYSLNGGDFLSLPGDQTDRLFFPANG